LWKGNAYETPPMRHGDFSTLFVSLISVGIGQSMLFAVLPPAARDLGVSPFQVSTIFAVSATIWVFVSPWWGRRSDVVGRRPVILVGLLGYALSMALVASTLTAATAGVLAAALVHPALIASRSMFALLGSGTGPAAQAYVADRTTPTERAAGVALMSGSMGLGETIGPGLAGLLASLGLAAPIYVAAGLAVASAVLVWRRLPDDPVPRRPASREITAMRVSDRRVTGFVMIGTALQAVRATTVITLALYLQDTLHLSSSGAARFAGFGFMTLALAGLFSQVVVVQRLRPRARTMIRTGTPLVLIAFVLLALPARFPVVLSALALLGLGLGLVRPGLSAAVSLAVEADRQGAAAGLLSGFAVIGNVLGPLAATALYASTPVAPYLLNVAIMLPVLGYALLSRRVHAIPA
jgi:MFS family permease